MTVISQCSPSSGFLVSRFAERPQGAGGARFQWTVGSVRTGEEREHLGHPFAMHIPIYELPDRLGELPRDKFIITFCLTGFRGVMAYAYDYPILAGGIDSLMQLTFMLRSSRRER